MVKVPVRADVVVFAATVYLTVPLPLPLAPAVTVIHAALLAAVHVQPVTVVTFAVAVPPAAGSDCVVGAVVKVHAAACVTVTVCPAIVSVPVRTLGSVLTATL